MCLRTGPALRIHNAIKTRPILSLPTVGRNTQLSFATASSAVELLVKHEIAREITGRPRNRLFVYDRYLSILNEGLEVL